MISVNIYYKGTNGSAKKFVEEMIKSGVVDEIRAEKGNLGYEYFSLRTSRKSCSWLTNGKIKMR